MVKMTKNKMCTNLLRCCIYFYSEKLPIGYRMTQRQDSRSSNTEKSKGYDAGKI